MRLPAYTPKQLLRIFRQAGFLIDHQSGSHIVLRHPDGRRTVIPYHTRDLKRGTLMGIIKQAGYTIEEFLKID